MSDLTHVLKHDGGCFGCAFSPSSKSVLTMSADMIKVWDGQTGRAVSTTSPTYYVPHNFRSHVLAHSHNGPKIIKVQRDPIVMICDPWTGTCGHVLYGLRSFVTCCAVSPDDTHLAIGTSGGALDIWNVRTDTRDRRIYIGDGIPYWMYGGCSYSMDGLLLACPSSNKSFKVWTLDDGACIFTLCGHADTVHSCIFSSRDPTLLATTSSDTTVKLWNARTGICLNTLIGHEASVYKCSFSKDNIYLASISADTTTRIWNVYTGICVHMIRHAVAITCCDFSCDSSLLVTSSAYAARVWRLPSVLWTNVKLLLVILCGNRCCSLWLPTELWNWMNAQWFFLLDIQYDVCKYTI